MKESLPAGLPPRPRRGRFEALRAALARKALARLLLVFFLAILAFAGMEATFALWAMAQFGWGPAQIGYVFTYVGLLSAVMQGGLIGRLTARFGEEKLLVAGLTLIALGLAILPFAHGLAILLAAVTGLALGMGAMQPSLNSLISRRAGAEEQGEVMGVAQSVGSLSRVLGPLLAGALFAGLGRDSPFLCGMVLVAAAALVGWRLPAAEPAPTRNWRNEAAPMSPRGRMPPSAMAGPKGTLIDGLRALKGLFPYLWPRDSLELRVRVVLAVALLAGGKLINITIPFFYKGAVDALSGKSAPGGGAAAVAAVPVMLIVAYGVARLFSGSFNELRNAVFAKVEQRAIRRVALQTFRHLHRLALRFHLERQTGGLSRAIERGANGIEFLLSFMLFNVMPTLIEILLVCGILWRLYDWTFAAVTFVTIGGYIWFTFAVTEWRIKFRRRMNDARHRGQRQGGRQPAELRDRQVLRQRGARGAALRRGARGL